MITAKDIINALHIPKSTGYKLLKYLDLPYEEINGKRYYRYNKDTKTLLDSIQLSLQYKQPAIFTIKELSIAYCKTIPTVTKIIRQSKIKTYKIGPKNSKTIIFLVDLVSIYKKNSL